jgi:hypothetical protein
MCGLTDCQHAKFDPNTNKTLGVEEQAQLWADIKTTRKAMDARIKFLKELGLFGEERFASDPQMIKLEAMTRSLWAQFRVL